MSDAQEQPTPGAGGAGDVTSGELRGAARSVPTDGPIGRHLARGPAAGESAT
jgi:hypothetical protein